jgi:peptide methionine sulfoxide reductase MsrB
MARKRLDLKRAQEKLEARRMRNRKAQAAVRRRRRVFNETGVYLCPTCDRPLNVQDIRPEDARRFEEARPESGESASA